MRNAKALLCATLFVSAIGWALLTWTEPTAANQKVEVVESHWRFHDGHWNYYHAADKRWYYTDGRHWFYHNGTGWAIYEFDRGFGREHVIRGEYKVPGREVKIVVPTHAHYR
jgi:hypothetical protein